MNTWIIGVHLLTAHAQSGYEATTPGLYVRHESGFTAGAYRNSIGRDSAYAGWSFETEDKRYALTVGAVTGYKRQCTTERTPYKNKTGSGTLVTHTCVGHTPNDVSLLVVPSMKLGSARLSLVAYKKPAVHLSWEF